MTTRAGARFLAQGMPVGKDVAAAASAWLTEIMSGEMTPQDEQRWMAWRNEHPDHERAWKHIEGVLRRLGTLDRSAAARSLAALERRASTRRTALRAILGLGVSTGLGYAVYRSPAARYWTADFRTHVGRQRSIALDDGTRIMLNTDSAIDVSFTGAQRLVRLVAGEILVETGHAPFHGTPSDPRPFIVQTRDGHIRALGTRFVVRQYEDDTSVGVLESAVEIIPDAAPGDRLRLQSGQRATFTRTSVHAPAALSMADSAWAQGQLIAENATLGDFVEELGRFRRGWIRCDPRVASLRFSGVFPATDTDRILALLPNTLPVRIRRYSPYLITIGPQE
ncbi:FecR domain-containing protein [Achromobacter aloeverae]